MEKESRITRFRTRPYEKKRKVKNSVARLIVSVLGFVMQTSWIVHFTFRINQNNVWMDILIKVLMLLLVGYLYENDHTNSNVKLVWIIMILLLPIVGIVLYMMYGRRGAVGFARKRYQRSREFASRLEICHPLPLDLPELEENRGVSNQMRYIRNRSGYQAFRCDEIEYFSAPEDAFGPMLERLKAAKNFIFMEFFAIEDAEVFDMVLAVLQERVAHGVEVRIIYDDVGSVGFLNLSFMKKMQSYGIQCYVFNHVLPVLNIFMQNRDHRKMVIIDGTQCFTGGYNLADEYFGLTKPYGQWKDTGIYFNGPAVQSQTRMFLEMWNMIKRTDEDIEKYSVYCTADPDAKIWPRTDRQGYIQPYADSPLNNEPIAENVYLNIIKNTKKYLYISTPYLILGTEMANELILAAKRGVDVRIVTPGIPDKKMIYRATRANYADLLKGGVHIYEYTPGFCHAKMFLSDDEVAVVGTINLDYRSLCHHFENAVFMYAVPVLGDIRVDFANLFEASKRITLSSRPEVGYKVGQLCLKFISPLL